jgi:WD40 repeat protein
VGFSQVSNPISMSKSNSIMPITTTSASISTTVFTSVFPSGNCLVLIAIDIDTLACGGQFELRIVNTKTITLKRIFVPTYTVHALAVLNNNREQVSGDYEGLVRIWHVKNGTERMVIIIKAHDPNVMSLIVTKDDGYIVSGSSDTFIKVWDAKSGQLKRTLAGNKKT